MRKFLHLFVCGLLLAASAGQLKADFVVNPVSATTNMGSGVGTLLDNTINGVGLSSFPSLSATHEGTAPLNSWVSNGVLTGIVDFDLGGSFNIDGFSFWNQNGGGPGALGTTGIQDVTVLASTDGVNFSAIAGAPSLFAQVTGSGPELPEAFSFGAVNANFIRFDVASNYGDPAFTGFGEVAFHATIVPEPTTFILLGIGSAVLATSRRRGR